jgi:uncharacterized protein (TIGR02466 family)
MSAPKLIDVTPFEPLIIKAHYDGFDWNKLEPVVESLIKKTKIKVNLESGDAASSASLPYPQPHNVKELQDFYKWLDPIVQHILLNEWDLYTGHKYQISNSWVNFHGKGGVTEKHHHGATVLTTAAYLQMPEDGGYIEFRDPLEYHKGFYMKNYDDEMFGWKRIPAVTGDVLFFPGYLRHRTQPNNNQSMKRWVLTTNYLGSFTEKI